jgi:hypothetical protein
VEFASSVVVLTAFKVSVMPSGVFGTTLPLPSTAPLNESFRWSNQYLKYPLGSEIPGPISPYPRKTSWAFERIVCCC